MNFRSITRIAVPVIAAACVLLTAPAAASAAPAGHFKDTEGAAATCTLSHSANRGYGGIACTLRDTARDGNAPYVEWNSDSYSGWRRIYNKNGDGSSLDFTRTRFLDGGHMLKWRVCRDRGTFQTDNCSSTRTWIF
jgi:hypothetical protein